MSSIDSFKRAWRDIFVGGAAGASAVAVIQPMIYGKNAAQTKGAIAFSMNPRTWYRGVGGFAGSFVPTVAIQVAIEGMLSGRCHPLVAAVGAGAASALVVCPAEAVMTQQQKEGKSWTATVQHIYRVCGMRGFFRAIGPTAVREGSFTGAYLGAAPRVKERLQSHGVNEWVAQGVAGVTSGTAAALVSHPFDTFKTRMQGDLSRRDSFFRTGLQRGAFAGLKWRAGMVATATVIIPMVKERLNAFIGR